MLITPEEVRDLQHLINATGDTLLKNGKMCLESGYVLEIYRHKEKYRNKVLDEIIKIEIRKENP